MEKLDPVAMEMPLTSERLFIKDESHVYLTELSSCQRESIVEEEVTNLKL